ncbi:YtpI family protein [Alkalihalobacillus sp. LMS39]|uniref:YtpI family protein n=1 Tax=Alkalihalobacillus sp. LMS39 TaxID=2924032 RepID=UPI001FB3C4E2|nr:YtpI family protein [Alkalihalobacillus sp. LMS39]UOE93432.1 YtpI family protein [Alkalihalobacillus sp. LMS39]
MVQTFFILIIFSIVFFFYFKVKYWRTHQPIMKKWTQTKANMALGSFLLFFGLNSLLFPRSTLEIVIGVIFSLLGSANIYFGYKAYKHYMPYALQEAENQK